MTLGQCDIYFASILCLLWSYVVRGRIFFCTNSSFRSDDWPLLIFSG